MEEAKQEPDRGLLVLQMLALDQLGRYDEAKVIFQKLLEQSEFDLELLARISRALSHDFFADLSRLMLYQEPCAV